MSQIKLIDNPFRKEKNAEHIDFNEIYSLFADPPDYEKYLQPEHCILIGSTGSGKSTLLKALSLPVQLKREKLENLPFYGIYICFRNPELKHLVRLYEDYNDFETLEHFFSVKAALEVLVQLKGSIQIDQYKMLEILPKVINEEYELSLGDSEVNGVIKKLKEMISLIRNNIINNVLIGDLSKRSNMKVLKLDNFISTIERINEELLMKIGKQRLCFLVDKYDYWRGLIQVLNIFLDHSLKEILCVKFAARYLPESFASDISGRKIDKTRDLKILSVDHNIYDPQYEKLLRTIVNKIVSPKGRAEIDKTKIFSEEAPTEIDSIVDRSVSPGENLRRLRTFERGTSRNMRQKLYYGFDCLAKLSGGNVLTFLNLCEKAIDNEFRKIEKEGKKEVNSISAESQSNAFVSLSRLVFNKDINVETEDEFREIRSFIYSFGRDCEGKGMELDTFEGSAFSIPLNIDEAVRKILRKAFCIGFFYVIQMS